MAAPEQNDETQLHEEVYGLKYTSTSEHYPT
jgi:hypothetical protein